MPFGTFSISVASSIANFCIGYSLNDKILTESFRKVFASVSLWVLDLSSVIQNKFLELTERKGVQKHTSGRFRFGSKLRSAIEFGTEDWVFLGREGPFGISL